MSAYQIGQLIDKMGNPDKDFRFMACNDLMKDLEGGNITLEDDSTAKVMRSLLRLLNDTNGEVQNLAIKCIGLLAQPSRIKAHHLEYLVEELTPYVFSKNEQARDIHTLTLKAMILNLAPISSSPVTLTVIKRMLPKFIDSLPQCAKDDNARVDVLDLIGEVLLRFGEHVPDMHKSLLNSMTDHLYSNRSTIRKKATTGIGHLASVINIQLYDELVGQLLNELTTKASKSSSDPQTRTLVVALSTIARASGTKFSKHTQKVIPHLLKFLNVPDDVECENDDLREASLQGLEVFLYRSPQEVVAFQKDVVNQLIRALAYDPNYEYGDEDEDERMEDDQEEEDDDYSDDEDVTWKVRRAAAKAIEAMVSSHRESLLSLTQTLGPIVIGRFKEREETVRTEIISVYIALLEQIAIVVPDLQKGIAANDENSIETDDLVVIGGTKFSSNYLSASQLEIIKALSDQKDTLLRVVIKSMKKHPKTGPKCIELLSALIKAFPPALEGSLDEVIPGVSNVLSDKGTSAQGKMIILSFVSKALALNESASFQNLLSPLSFAITQSISDSFYKVSAEGLVVACRYIEILSDLSASGEAKKLLQVIETKFMSNETDQEVRERSITAVSTLLSAFRNDLKNEMTSILEKMSERIGRDMTCLVALRASTQIVEAGIVFNQNQMQSILRNLVEYLKKQARSLRMTSLNFFEKLMKHTPASAIPADELSTVLGELPSLITETDLQISSQSFCCLTYAFLNFPHCVSLHLEPILQAIVRLLQSSLIGGVALTSLLNLFTAIVKTDFPQKPSFEALLDMITAPVYDNVPLTRHAHMAIASSAAVITESTQNLEKSRSLAKKLAQQQGQTTESIRLFAMMALGELGRRVPETYGNDFAVKPEELACKAFNTSHEDLKAAAAQTLGALAVGNLNVYLPFILDQIRTQPKKQYLLLHALKEVIVWESSSDETTKSTALFRSAINDIWGMLMANAGGSEDGTRSVVAECLGRLCSFDPETLLPKLKESMKSKDPAIRAAVVSAIKFMINDGKRSVDVSLQKHIGDFLVAVRDDDLKVRRVALVVLNSAAHNKASLVRDLLPDLLPTIYEETKLRKELIKEVEMGPFKHLVDEGLDLRKCAFECMFTLLESCVDKIDITEFSTVMEVGLSDQNHDVKLLNYLTLQRVATLAPGHVLQRIDRVCDPLKVQLNVRPRGNAVKQEIEKLEELKKAVIRVVYGLKTKLPDVERHPQYVDLYNTIKHNRELEVLAEIVLKESQRAVVYDTPMETA
uniref:TIP120 domain-containing protein n=1 Tax=Caenorhabditis tropicalis TaxID=1561998 RepID=A0A1I7SZC2_9PELO